MDGWNATERGVPARVAHRRAVRGAGGAEAGGGGGRVREARLTYAGAGRRARTAGAPPARAGSGPETCGWGSLWSGRRELPVALLGIVKAGGAYVPLDPSYPTERLRFMVEDSRVPVLLTQERLLARLPAHGGARVVPGPGLGRACARQSDGGLGGAAGGREPRLRDLHVGLDGDPEGGGGARSGRGQPPGVGHDYATFGPASRTRCRSSTACRSTPRRSRSGVRSCTERGWCGVRPGGRAPTRAELGRGDATTKA